MKKVSPRETVIRKYRISGVWVFLAVSSTLACILCIYFLVKAKAFAFVDVGSDTFFCFYPLQIAVARQMQTLHAVSWSFDLGLGGFLGMLFDPLWLITGWLPDSWQLALRLPMFLLRLLLGGAFFYGYLRQIDFDEPIAIIGALGYAFSSYALINVQWEVMHGTEFVQFAACLFLLERYLHSRQRWAAISAGVVVGLGHPFGLYMLGLFMAIYGAARLLLTSVGERREIALRFTTFAAWAVPGLAIAAPLLFPGLHYLFDSPRVALAGAHSQMRELLTQIFSLNDRSIIAAEIAGLVGKDLLGTGTHYVGWQNYFEAPGFYVGLLPLLCIGQLFGPNARRRERILALTGIAGIMLYFVWPPLRYAVYGFGHFVFRFSTVWISALLLVLGLIGLRRALVSGWWRPGIAIGAAAILLSLLGATYLMQGAVDVGHLVRVIAFTGLYCAIALLFSCARKQCQPSPGNYVLVAICACELLTFAIPPLVERDAVNRDGSSSAGRYNDDTVQALAFVREHNHDDDAFFRIEKTYSSVFLDDALAQGYSGTASYFFHAASITRFVDRMGLPRNAPYANYISPMTTRPLVLDLLAVRYLLSRDRKPDQAEAMTFVGSAGDVNIYRNDAAHGFAAFYDSIASEQQADALAPAARDAFLLKTAIVDDPQDIDTRLAHLPGAAETPPVSRRARIRKPSDDTLYGEVETPSASLLLLAMPFDRGWSAQLDGADVDLFRADYGLTATLIPAGSHVISLAYVPPGRKLGFSLMAGALAFIATFEWLSKRQRARSTARSWLDRINRFPYA